MIKLKYTREIPSHFTNIINTILIANYLFVILQIFNFKRLNKLLT